MGDHTDYSNLPVLPIAIQYGVDVAGAHRSDRLVVAHSLVTSSTAEVSLDSLQDEQEDWGRYLRGALLVLADRKPDRGASLLIDGDLPTTGGLSSSSALTVGLSCTLNEVWDLGLSLREIVDRSIVAERHVGVESGGMDQTVIAFAQPGHALRIGFEPNSLTHVPIPPELKLVAGYSGESAPKGGSARDFYNRSVVAGRAATLLLAHMAEREVPAPLVLASMTDMTSDALAELPSEMTAGRAAARSGYPVADLVSLTNGVFPEDMDLPVRAVATHVLSEATRVDQAVAALNAGDGVAVGRIFDESHASLERFGSVTPGLTMVCKAARGAGAWGARVTGAGFGGWAVAVCPPAVVTEVRSAMIAATGGPSFEVVASGGLG